MKSRGYQATDRPTDLPTDRPTDIATYRAAIAAKNASNVYMLLVGNGLGINSP